MGEGNNPQESWVQPTREHREGRLGGVHALGQLLLLRYDELKDMEG